MSKERQAQIEVSGKTFTFQKLPVKAAFDLRNGWVTSDGGINQERMYKLVFEHLVVSPKVQDVDEVFEDIWEMDKVVQSAIEFQYGKKK